LVFSSASMRRTTTRSCSGRNFIGNASNASAASLRKPALAL
jgi:hypothetical protein